MGRWLQANFGSSNVISKSSQSLLHTAPTLPGGQETTYGMGWYEISQPDLPTYLGHGGNLYTYASHVVYDPSTRTGISVLLNANGPASLLTVNLLRAAHDQPLTKMQNPSFSIDLALLALGTLSLLFGMWGIWQAPIWTRRVQRQPGWMTALRLLPLVLLPGLVAILPVLLFGADITAWPVMLTLLPSATATIFLAFSCLLVLLARLKNLRRVQRQG